MLDGQADEIERRHLQGVYPIYHLCLDDCLRMQKENGRKEFFDTDNQLDVNKFYSGFMEIACQIMDVRYII